MTKSNRPKVLTFEMNPDRDELEIHCNNEGMDEFIARLTALRASKRRPDHDHLMTRSWSGHELTEASQSDQGRLLHMVTIRLQADE
ncbi:MAG: Imm32 family immunity protein [Parvibaculaceae bacterium]